MPIKKKKSLSVKEDALGNEEEDSLQKAYKKESKDASSLTYCYPQPRRQLGLFFAVIVFVLLLVAFAVGGFFVATNGFQQLQLSYSSSQSALQTQPSQLAVQGAPNTASVNIVAVGSDGTGLVSTGTVQVIQGNGQVLFSLNPFIEPDTQSSVQTAAAVAQQFTGQDLSNKDIIYGVADTNAQLVGGPSAGVAMTVATIAALEGKQVRSDAAITGTINSDGSIGQVGGVLEKAVAAAKDGMNVFIVPKGQAASAASDGIQMQTVIWHRGRYIIRNTTQTATQGTSLQQYLNQQGYKMQVVEAANIGDAVKLLVQ